MRTASAVECQAAAAAVDDGGFATVALELARKKLWRWSFVKRNRAIQMARLQWGKKRGAAVEEFVVAAAAEQDAVVAVAVFAIEVHATGEAVMMVQAGCCRSQHLHLQQTRESQSPGLKLGHRTRSWRRRKVWAEAGTCL